MHAELVVAVDDEAQWDGFTAPPPCALPPGLHSSTRSMSTGSDEYRVRRHESN